MIGLQAGGTPPAVQRVIAGGAGEAAVLTARPYETSPTAEVLYRAVNVRGARRRVIVTRPRREGIGRYNGMRDFTERQATGGDGFDTGLLEAVFGWLEALN